jgi:dihydrofolate reductase
MARLIYSVIASLDGYVADERGNFDWAEPDDEVHSFVNELERPVGTYLYGRGMYETMRYWETAGGADEPPVARDFAAMWRAARKIVYSRTLEAVSSGGPGLAAQALAAGLVDECQLFLAPVIVGGGKPSLPSNVRLNLELLHERRFGNGTVYLRYRCLD